MDVSFKGMSVLKLPHVLCSINALFHHFIGLDNLAFSGTGCDMVVKLQGTQYLQVL
jgi:hypothetical protein